MRPPKRSYSEIAQDDTPGAETPDPNKLLRFHEIRVGIETISPHFLANVEVVMEFHLVFPSQTNDGSLYFAKERLEDGLPMLEKRASSEDCHVMWKRRAGLWRKVFTMSAFERDFWVQAGRKCKIRFIDWEYHVAEIPFDKDNQHPIKTFTSGKNYGVEIAYSLKAYSLKVQQLGEIHDPVLELVFTTQY